MESNSVSVEVVKSAWVTSPNGNHVIEDIEFGAPEMIPEKSSEEQQRPLSKLEQLQNEINEFNRLEADIRKKRRDKNKRAKASRKRNR